MRRLVLLLLFFVLLHACRPPVYPPKPQGYFRIDTPARHEYRLFSRPGFPYTFEYPVYATIADDTVFQAGGAHNPYWINIHFDSLGGEINLTYKIITPAEPFMKLVAESDEMSFKHEKKADNIQPIVFRFPEHRVSGILYTLYGNAASRYQFTASDTVKNFIRGAMYFNVTPNADSLRPVTDFLVQDIHHILETLQWRQ